MKETATRAKRAVPTLRRILYYVGIGICALLLVIASWLCIDKYIRKSPVPSFCGFATLVVTTGSMSGTIEENDYVLIMKQSSYRSGEIITFQHEGDAVPTTHRILYVNEDGTYTTKGDFNTPKDTLPVRQDEIYGKVILRMHYLSLFVGWLTTGGGYIYLLGVVLILGIGIYLIKDERRRAREAADPASDPHDPSEG